MMLAVKNLVKVYKTKGGVEVRALDGVSVDFPDKGMVFLLGKSGSGKSTLLNVAGGLDAPDSGEIIVKGKSSVNFTQSDFDSYRNTYVGFIFQEYNILNEFNVEQNIAIALQLQGKKNDKESVNRILDQVDLKGLGHRKPMTLSGGQKQRVAIARALIKEPEIIMADEPTGALDSVTGKDVLDTLKKLSATRLVIIVSHDVEFAELYGDRIIELKDGKIISDVSKNFSEPVAVSDNIRTIDDKTLSIKKGGKLSQDEIDRVLNLLGSETADGEIIISSDAQKVENFKKANRISKDGNQEYFAKTTEKDIVAAKYDGSQTKFIKSNLPMSHAVKIGASSMKAKPIRLILTIFISLLAFGLFGVVSTMMLYDVNFTAAKALEGTSYSAAVLQKNYNTKTVNTNYYYEKGKDVRVDKYEYTNQNTTLISPGEWTDMGNSSMNVSFAGIYQLNGSYSQNDYRINNMLSNGDSGNGYYNFSSFRGFSDAGENYLKKTFGTSTCIAGAYPLASTEIAVSEYMYEVIKKSGLKAFDPVSNITGNEIPINAPIDLIGNYIVFQSYNTSDNYKAFKVTGIYNTGAIDAKYDVLKSSDSMNQNDMALREEFNETFSMYHTLAYVSDSFYAANVTKPASSDSDDRIQLDTGYAQLSFSDYFKPNNMYWGSVNFVFPEWLDKYAGDAAVYSFANGNSIPVSSIKTFADDETYISTQTLYSRANILYNAEMVVSAGGLGNEQYKTYITENPDFYEAYLRLQYYVQNYWSGSDAQKPAKRELTQHDMKTILNALNSDWNTWVRDNSYKGYYQSDTPYGDADKAYYGGGSYLKIIGVYVLDMQSYSLYILNRNFVTANSEYYYYNTSESNTKYVPPADGKYSAIITPMQTTRDALDYILSLNKPASDDSLFMITNNSIYSNASSAGYMFDQMWWIFAIVGGVLALISALFLFNYISISIVDKSREIGILRAVGARGTDVFKIFFSESAIISLICTVLAIIAAIVACVVTNMIMASSVFPFQLLNFTFLNGLIIFGIAVLVAFAGTIIPVYRAAKRVPVESIRSL